MLCVLCMFVSVLTCFLLQVFCCPLESTEIVAYMGKANKSRVVLNGSRCVKGDFRWKPEHQQWIRDCKT